jgi:predicted GNAT family acetyltransferase
MPEEQPVINNEKNQRFEISMDGELAILEYRFHKDDIALMHTFVPEDLFGKGLASALAHQGLEWAREHKRRVLVYCPFVAAYIKRHPEYNSIIDQIVDGKQTRSDGL